MARHQGIAWIALGPHPSLPHRRDSTVGVRPSARTRSAEAGGRVAFAEKEAPA